MPLLGGARDALSVAMGVSSHVTWGLLARLSAAMGVEVQIPHGWPHSLGCIRQDDSGRHIRHRHRETSSVDRQAERQAERQTRTGDQGHPM